MSEQIDKLEAGIIAGLRLLQRVSKETKMHPDCSASFEAAIETVIDAFAQWRAEGRDGAEP